MYQYTVIEAVAAVIAGVLLALCTKRADGVTYGKLDRIGQVTNVLLFFLFYGNLLRPLN